MVNAIPIIGWLISMAVNASLAVPFWICWTSYGIGQKYFTFLPSQWQSIPFWDCLGLFISVSVIKCVFVPKLAEVNQKNVAAKE